MKTITLGKRKIKIAEEWAELTPEQYEKYMVMRVNVMSIPALRDAYEKKFFSHLIGLQGADWEKITRFETKHELAAEFEESRKWWGFDRPLDTGGINPVPLWSGCLGPGHWLTGMKWGEFTKCITLAGAEDAGVGEWIELARVMYRIPEGKFVYTWMAVHCVCLFMSVVNAIRTGPVNLNGQDVDLSIIFGLGDAGKPDDKTGWTGITFAVAESGVFGDYAKVNDTEFWDVLLYLYKCRFSEINKK